MSRRVVVLTRPGCHLCTDACAVVQRVATDMDFEWAEQDITGDAELTAKWGEYIPVVIVDGEVHTWFRVDENRLRAALF
ncbi:MAG TPA: glutaredoxin family protein [Mycobacteriales bacterium]|nr:glutaredoxin family protein [Mycobacteriales bacterium]